MRRLDFCTLDAGHERAKVLSPVNYRNDKNARFVQAVDDAIAVDQPLTDGWIIDFRHDPTQLGILRNGFGCFDNL